MALRFFCRHGKQSDDALTESGTADVKAVRDILTKRGFVPNVVYSSTARRCIQTAEILAEGHSIQEHCVFRRFVTWPPNPNSYEELLFGATLEPLDFVVDLGIDLLVTHDSLPCSLAFMLLEKQGVEIAWDAQPWDIMILEQGCGILFDDETLEWELITPPGYVSLDDELGD